MRPGLVAIDSCSSLFCELFLQPKEAYHQSSCTLVVMRNPLSVGKSLDGTNIIGSDELDENAIVKVSALVTHSPRLDIISPDVALQFFFV